MGRGRRPCCLKEGLNKGTWTAMEDKILKDYISTHGQGKWRNLPNMAGLKRCGKSCRLRWLNYLRPNIKRGNISEDEEDLIIRLHNLLGNRWSLIAGRLPGRTDNEVKNYWNTTIMKKVQRQQVKSQISDRKITLDKSKQKQSLPASSCVVLRPKASRWTNAIITPEQEKTQQLDAKSVAEQNTNSVAVPQEFCGGDHSAIVPQEPYRGDSTYDLFTTDLERDDKFLSEFLSTEFAPSCDLIGGSNGENNTNTLIVDSSWDVIRSMGTPCDIYNTDFEMDDKFLSEFLNTEFAPLGDLIDGSEGDDSATISADSSWDNIIGFMPSILDPERLLD